MTRTRTRRAALALTMAAPLVAAAAIGDQTTPPADNGAQIQQGRALYTRLCAHCHGFNMVTPGTVAFDLRTFPHDDKARFVNSVIHGKNNRMPPWGDMLTPEQIDELWAYVSSAGKS